MLLAPGRALIPLVFLVSLASLALLGMLGARTGGAPVGKAVRRVAFWGVLAMGITAAAGSLLSGLGR